MADEKIPKLQVDSKDASTKLELLRLTGRSNHMWVLLWSLLLGGVNFHFDGRTPVVLYFDVVLALWLVYQMSWNASFPDFSGWIVRLGAFCLVSGVLSAMVNTHDIYKSLAALKVLACGLLVYAVARKSAPSVFAVSLWGAAVGILLLANYQTVQYGVYQGEAGLKDEIGIVLGRSNYVASILLLLIPLAIAGVSFHRGKIRLVFAGCAMLMFAGLIVTMSRGAVLAILLATILSLPLMYKAGLRVKHVIPVLVLSAAVMLLLPSDLVMADAALVVYRWTNPDLSRAELMKVSWQSFQENPVLGVGPGQLGEAMASRMVVPDYSQQYMNSHNLIVNALAENGLPAGLALLAMVGVVLYRALKRAVIHSTPLDVALWLALFAAVIHNMVEASFEGLQFQVVFWTVVGMAEARHRCVRAFAQSIA